MSRNHFIFLGTLLVLVIGTSMFVAQEESDSVGQANAPSEKALNNTTDMPPVATGQLPYASEYGALASSLKDIYFDRDLATDEEGNVRISSDLKDVFDFFFSAIEEEELEVVLARIDEYLAYKLEDPALTQARKILSDYVAYKSALYDFEEEQSGQVEHLASAGADAGQLFNGEYLNFIEQRQEAVAALRAQYLGSDVHEAFFASREQYDSYMVQKLKITADKNASDEQKAAMLLALDSQMPAEFIESRAQANPVETLRTAVTSSQAESAEQVYAARASAVGVEAADRLTSLDQQRADWKAKYQNYRQHRELILENTGLSGEDQALEIAALQQRTFSENEQVRVKALDQIGGLSN